MSWIDRYFFGVQTLQNQGATLPNAPTVNYSGSGVTTTVDTNTGIATVNITAGGGASQTTTALSNGLNSNVATAGQSSVRFGSYSGAVILGGLALTPAPTPGVADRSHLHHHGAAGHDPQPRRVEHGDEPDPHRHGGDVLLPVGGAPRARLVWDATASSWALQLSGAHQEPHLNILNFGADPTGVAACDAAWTNLMAAAQGRIVDVPPGYYRFANTNPSHMQMSSRGTRGDEPAGRGAFRPRLRQSVPSSSFRPARPGWSSTRPARSSYRARQTRRVRPSRGSLSSRTSPARRRFGTRSRVALTRTGRRAPCTRWERSSFRRRTSNRAWPSWSRA